MQISVCQLAALPDVSANLDLIRRYTRQAADAGAALALFPEAAMYQCLSPAPALAAAAEPLDGPFVTGLHDLAAQTGTTVVVGMYESRAGLAREEPARPYNTVVAIGPDGMAGFHRKYLVYDAFGYRESDQVQVADAGADIFDVAGWTCGLITCYEIRFPEAARTLVDAGADLLLVSSAWPVGPAKEDHFITMVKARALENTVYLAAAGDCSPAMVGRSQVLDPLGYQLAGLTGEAGVCTTDIHHARLARARDILPVLAQRRARPDTARPPVNHHRLGSAPLPGTPPLEEAR